MKTFLRPWSPPGPIGAAAFGAWGPVVLIMGPPGSGKTGVLIFKSVAGTWMQHPWADGVRRARLVVICIDYRRLWGNFIPSWFEWIAQHDPENGITWTGARGGPAQQVIEMKNAQGEIARLEVIFAAIGDDHSEEAMEAFFAGMQATWIWPNEWQSFPLLAWQKAGQRVGRYPRAADAQVVGPGLWGDLNAGVVDTWHHQLWTGGQFRNGVHLFRQPGAFEPGAENVQNLPPGYYQNMMLTMGKDEIERKINNRWGRRLDGEPVWNFDDNIHVAPSVITPDYSQPLLIGMDAGLDPAALLGQRRADGQERDLAELVSEHGVGPERFGRRLRELLDTPRFGPFRQIGIEAAADPAAAYGADTHEGEKNWIQRVAFEAQIQIRPAPTNALQPRLTAVRDTLIVIEGQPMRLVDPVHCPMWRQALNGGYRWRKIKVVGSDRYDPEPDKGPHSHIADAGQYKALLRGGYAKAIGRQASDANAVRDMMRAQGVTAGAGEARRNALFPNRGSAKGPLFLR